MANKKVNQLTSKPSVNLTDLFLIADPTSGQAYKTTISDLGTAIGSGVSSVNGLVGAVVLDTDDIQELVSPTNKWFTDTRARAALSASSPLTYNSGTGAFGIQVANGSQNGYLSSTDWTTFNSKQAALSGTGFVKSTGGTISYDTNTYLTTSAAASTYLALAGGTMTGALFGTSASFSGYVGFNGNTSPLYPVDVAGSGRFSGDLRIESTNPRIYLTDTDNNPDYFISNTDGTFTIYDVTNSASRLTIGTSGAATFGSSVTATRLILSGGVATNTGLYYGHTDRVVLANYTAGGIDFETNGGVVNMTLFPSGGLYVGASGTDNGYKLEVNGTGKFNGALTGTSATFTSTITATGATLTGALSGTSATFNGNIFMQAPAGVGTFITLKNDSNTSGFDIGHLNGSGEGAYIYQRANQPIYIGTNNATRLTIASTGAATFSSGVTAAQLYTNSNAAASGFMQFNYATSNSSSRSWRLANDNVVYGDFAIQQSTTQTGTTFTNLLYINPSGNVGIGTTSPSYLLHVKGSGSYNGAILVDNTGTTAGGSIQFGVNGTAINSISVAGTYLGSTDQNLAYYAGSGLGHIFYTNAGSERMRITSAGSVFIGKTTGSSKFGVSGLPTSSAGLSSGDFYQVAGAVMVVP